jgi:hypothetical protein
MHRGGLLDVEYQKRGRDTIPERPRRCRIGRSYAVRRGRPLTGNGLPHAAAKATAAAAPEAAEASTAASRRIARFSPNCGRLFLSRPARGRQPQGAGEGAAFVGTQPSGSGPRSRDQRRPKNDGTRRVNRDGCHSF